MRDIDEPPDEDYSEIDPEDPHQQTSYIRRVRGLYSAEIQGFDRTELDRAIVDALRQCPDLKIRSPRDILRFLRLMLFVRPALSKSPFLSSIIDRILYAVHDWSATKRLDFLDKYVVNRSPPQSEPDFGPWLDTGDAGGTPE